MSTVYSTRLLVKAGFTGWAYTTVPAGKRWVIKQVDIYNQHGSGINCLVTCNGVVFFAAAPLASATTAHWSGMQVLDAGEQIGVMSDVAGGNFVISGYEFANP